MDLPVLIMHRILAGDDVPTEVAYETIPNLEVLNRRDSVGRAREPILRPGLRLILQRIEDGTPLDLSITVVGAFLQMVLQGVAVDPDPTLGADRDLPGLVIADH